MIVTVIELLEARLEELKRMEQTEEVQYRMKEVERTLQLISAIDDDGNICRNENGQLVHYKMRDEVIILK